MKHRSWRLLLVTLVVVVALAAGGYTGWNRPAPEPTIEHVSQADGSTLTNVLPGEKAAQVERLQNSVEFCHFPGLGGMLAYDLFKKQDNPAKEAHK